LREGERETPGNIGMNREGEREQANGGKDWKGMVGNQREGDLFTCDIATTSACSKEMA
jgi:hypothetical protein